MNAATGAVPHFHPISWCKSCFRQVTGFARTRLRNEVAAQYAKKRPATITPVHVSAETRAAACARTGARE